LAQQGIFVKEDPKCIARFSGDTDVKPQQQFGVPSPPTLPAVRYINLVVVSAKLSHVTHCSRRPGDIHICGHAANLWLLINCRVTDSCVTFLIISGWFWPIELTSS